MWSSCALWVTPSIRYHIEPDVYSPILVRDLTVRVPQVEFIIMGGTFMSLGQTYRDGFVSQLHNSLSGYTGNDVDEAVRCVRRLFLLILAPIADLRCMAQRYAEQAKTKCIGITIETRPDYCLKPHLSFVLALHAPHPIKSAC